MQESVFSAFGYGEENPPPAQGVDAAASGPHSMPKKDSNAGSLGGQTPTSTDATTTPVVKDAATAEEAVVPTSESIEARSQGTASPFSDEGHSQNVETPPPGAQPPAPPRVPVAEEPLLPIGVRDTPLSPLSPDLAGEYEDAVDHEETSATRTPPLRPLARPSTSAIELSVTSVPESDPGVNDAAATASSPTSGLDDDDDESQKTPSLFSFRSTAPGARHLQAAVSSNDASSSSAPALLSPHEVDDGGPASNDDDRRATGGARPQNNSRPAVVVPGDADFERLSVLGVGSFGRVVLARLRSTKEQYAVKLVAYSKLTNPKHLERTIVERDVLARDLNHRHVVDLAFAFRTPFHFALVFEFCPGGELFHQLQKKRRFDARTAAFYAAEHLLALSHAHSKGVVYRDVKPENCLLDEHGHLKLADFGLAKRDIWHRFEGAHSICGTLEYMAPDVLARAPKGYGTAVDIWGLGIWTYELLTGLPPWHAKDKKKLFHDIRFANLRIPPSVPISAALFVAQLVRRHPRDRLTDLDALKAHAFFADFKYDLDTISDHPDPPLNPCARLRGCRRNKPQYYNFDLKFARIPVSDRPDEVTPDKDQQITAEDDVPGWDFARDEVALEDIVVVDGDRVLSSSS